MLAISCSRDGGMLARVLFAPDAPLSDKVLGIAIILAFAGALFILGWGILKVLRLSKSAAAGNEERIMALAAAEMRESMGQREVVFKFTTYTGFGIWLVQSTRVYALPHDVAARVLKRLLRHNMTIGLIGPGLVFVPFLSLMEYWQRQREIARQKEGFAVVQEAPFKNDASGS
jgi:hypothetical protein